jgi:hypothetical protein
VNTFKATLDFTPRRLDGRAQRLGYCFASVTLNQWHE